MQRYVSDPMPAPPTGFYRADLELDAVDHSNTSYVAHLHLNQPGADENTDRTADSGYAGHFTVFAHGDCWGDAGHCDISAAASPFDRRAPHPLTPIHISIEITGAVRAIGDVAELRVTILAFPVGNGKDASPLKFTRLRLVSYA